MKEDKKKKGAKWNEKQVGSGNEKERERKWNTGHERNDEMIWWIMKKKQKKKKLHKSTKENY